MSKTFRYEIYHHPSLPAVFQLSESLQRELASLPNNDTDSVASSSLSVREQLLQDLDDLVASDCILCGEAVIR